MLLSLIWIWDGVHPEEDEAQFVSSSAASHEYSRNGEEEEEEAMSFLCS